MCVCVSYEICIWPGLHSQADSYYYLLIDGCAAININRGNCQNGNELSLVTSVCFVVAEAFFNSTKSSDSYLHCGYPVVAKTWSFGFYQMWHAVLQSCCGSSCGCAAGSSSALLVLICANQTQPTNCRTRPTRSLADRFDSCCCCSHTTPRHAACCCKTPATID